MSTKKYIFLRPYISLYETGPNVTARVQEPKCEEGLKAEGQVRTICVRYSNFLLSSAKASQ